MNTNYDSFLEIAVALMKKKKKPQTLESITKEVFSKKGADGNELEIAQFQVDFMLSGYFVCCGEDKSGNQVWDLKNRVKSELITKDTAYMKEFTEEDQEANDNELKDDFQFGNYNDLDNYIDDDEDEETSEQDEIEEDLGIVSQKDFDEDTDESILNPDYVEEDEDDDIEDF